MKERRKEMNEIYGPQKRTNADMLNSSATFSHRINAKHEHKWSAWKPNESILTDKTKTRRTKKERDTNLFGHRGFSPLRSYSQPDRQISDWD